MQRLITVVVVVVGSIIAVSGSARAERRKVVLEGPGSCQDAASHLTATLSLDSSARWTSARSVVQHRCEVDAWSQDSKRCFAHVTSGMEASLCLDTLTKKQRKALYGDADRLHERGLSRWLVRGSFVAPTPAPIAVTFASYDASHPDTQRARLLYSQGMSAYQAGNYDVSSKKFAAAVTASPTADNVYLAAQAYRLKGDRARAIDLYERYLEIAPNGPAAPACRYQLERLRDALP
jgi:tetratricopeptide (TPR) repeat protein